MAFRNTALAGLLLLLSIHVCAIQVTPNSPCSSLCIDSSDLDVSDPNSSNTAGSDMACADGDFTSTAVGSKWKSCLSCLQNSTFSQGSESDQAWFFYNLRYSVDYCVLGYPNATGIGSDPCMTSTACGSPALLASLESDILSPSNVSEFGYCTADGGSGLFESSSYSSCLACVQASDARTVMANSLVALRAGCEQLPAPSTLVGVNDTIFAPAGIAIVSPASTTAAATASASHRMSTTTTAAIAIGAVAAVAVAGGVGFVLWRRRRQRRQRRMRPASPFWMPDGGRFGSGGDGHYALSPALSAAIGDLSWSAPAPPPGPRDREKAGYADSPLDAPSVSWSPSVAAQPPLSSSAPVCFTPTSPHQPRPGGLPGTLAACVPPPRLTPITTTLAAQQSGICIAGPRGPAAAGRVSLSPASASSYASSPGSAYGYPRAALGDSPDGDPTPTSTTALIAPQLWQQYHHDQQRELLSGQAGLVEPKPTHSPVHASSVSSRHSQASRLDKALAEQRAAKLFKSKQRHHSNSGSPTSTQHIQAGFSAPPTKR